MQTSGRALKQRLKLHGGPQHNDDKDLQLQTDPASQALDSMESVRHGGHVRAPGLKDKLPKTETFLHNGSKTDLFHKLSLSSGVP